MPTIFKNGKPYKTFDTLAACWIECFDAGLVVLVGGKVRGRKPGEPHGRVRARLAPGIHVVESAEIVAKAVPDSGFKVRPAYVKPTPNNRSKVQKRKFDTGNWMDEL